MLISNRGWGTIQPSVYFHAAGPLRRAKATPRGHGALRYQCPLTSSFVLVTDEATIASLTRPRARLRCMDCGEMHLLTQDAHAGAAAGIVATSAKP
jgi:hypothetical protein